MSHYAELVLYHGLPATGRLEVSKESDAGPWEALWLSQPLPLLDALAEWNNLANDVLPSRTWEFGATTSPARVGFKVSDGPGWVRMSPTLAALLGFSSQVLALSAQSDGLPLALLGDGIRIGRTFPRTHEQVDLVAYRGARATSYAHGRVLELDVELYVPAALWTQYRRSPLCSGHGARRIVTDVSDAFGANELGGSVLAYPIRTTRIERRSADALVRVSQLCTARDP